MGLTEIDLRSIHLKDDPEGKLQPAYVKHRFYHEVIVRNNEVYVLECHVIYDYTNPTFTIYQVTADNQLQEIKSTTRLYNDNFISQCTILFQSGQIYLLRFRKDQGRFTPLFSPFDQDQEEIEYPLINISEIIYHTNLDHTHVLLQTNRETTQSNFLFFSNHQQTEFTLPYYTMEQIYSPDEKYLFCWGFYRQNQEDENQYFLSTINLQTYPPQITTVTSRDPVVVGFTQDSRYVFTLIDEIDEDGTQYFSLSKYTLDLILIETFALPYQFNRFIWMDDINIVYDQRSGALIVRPFPMPSEDPYSIPGKIQFIIYTLNIDSKIIAEKKIGNYLTSEFREPVRYQGNNFFAIQKRLPDIRQHYLCKRLYIYREVGQLTKACRKAPHFFCQVFF